MIFQTLIMERQCSGRPALRCDCCCCCQIILSGLVKSRDDPISRDMTALSSRILGTIDLGAQHQEGVRHMFLHGKQHQPTRQSRHPECASQAHLAVEQKKVGWAAAGGPMQRTPVGPLSSIMLVAGAASKCRPHSIFRALRGRVGVCLPRSSPCQSAAHLFWCSPGPSSFSDATNPTLA